MYECTWILFEFTKFSKYAPSLIFDPRDDTSLFVMEVLVHLQEEYHLDLLYDKWTFLVSWFILNKWKRQGLRETVEMPWEQGDLMVVLPRVSLISKISLGSRRYFLINFLPSSLNLMMIGCLTLSLKRKGVLVHQTRSLLLSKTGIFISCCKSLHKVWDCPNLNGQDNSSSQAQESGSNVDAFKKYHFYALRSRGEQETSPDVVNGMLKVLFIDVYALSNPGATLSFVTAFIAKVWYFSRYS